MGIWGSSLYANDCSCDVRDTYKQFLQYFSNEDAYKKTIEEYSSYISTDEEPFLWYALADTQWRLGCLLPEVKDNALKWIAESGGLRFWTDSKNKGIGWKKTLKNLKDELESPMLPKKDLHQKTAFITNPWNVGDVYAYQFHKKTPCEDLFSDKYIVFQKLSDEEWFEGKKVSRIQVFNKIFDKIPQLSELDDVKILPLDSPEKFITHGYNNDFPLCLNAIIEIHRKNDYPKKQLYFIGNKSDNYSLPLANINVSYCFWSNIDEAICDYYMWWKEYDYTISNGKAKVFKKKSDKS